MISGSKAITNLYITDILWWIRYYKIQDSIKTCRLITVISGRLPAGDVLIFPQTVVGVGYRQVQVM